MLVRTTRGKFKFGNTIVGQNARVAHKCKAMKVANFNADFKRREHRSARRDLSSCEKKAYIFSSQQHKLRLLLE